MVKYWEKLIDLTVQEHRIEEVIKTLGKFGDAIVWYEHKIYNVDGERFAKFTFLLKEGGKAGKKVCQNIIRMLNTQ